MYIRYRIGKWIREKKGDILIELRNYRVMKICGEKGERGISLIDERELVRRREGCEGGEGKEG